MDRFSISQIDLFISFCIHRINQRRIRLYWILQINTTATTTLVLILLTSKWSSSINSSKMSSAIMKRVSSERLQKGFLIKSNKINKWKMNWRFTLPSLNLIMTMASVWYIKKSWIMLDRIQMEWTTKIFHNSKSCRNKKIKMAHSNNRTCCRILTMVLLKKLQITMIN